MHTTTKPKVLCVDDEQDVLDGLALHLRRGFDVRMATGGEAGLELLARERDVAVVVSDMRMPGMSGAEFLAHARSASPDSVRLLLTGHAELDAAIAAVNEGQIFRFLTKPCPATAMVATVAAAAEQHRLLTSERVLLEQTLHGCIKALTDILALTHPAAFGRAARVKERAGALATKLRVEPRWPVEVAAMLSQLGCVTLPESIVERLHRGQPLSESERIVVDRAGATTEQLLAGIPRLEPVRAILERCRRIDAEPADARPEAAPAAVEQGAALLRLALDLDLLEAQGQTPELAMATLRGRKGRYPDDVVEAATGLFGADGRARDVRELDVGSIRVGMVFVDDVRLAGGQLLVARGYKVTQGFVARVGNFPPGSVREPLRVEVATEAST